MKFQIGIVMKEKENSKMRLITRSDFDGLACGALLKEAGIIDHWKFAHPRICRMDL